LWRGERQLAEAKRQKDRLLDMRLPDEIDGDTFATKHRKLCCLMRFWKSEVMPT